MLAAQGDGLYPVLMEEMLDVVNEVDEVVGQATRASVHEQNLMHRATHIILTDSAERVFLQLRAKTKDTNPGLWDTSAAGHVDAGESYIDCAVREVEEELGVMLQADALFEVGRLPPSARNGFEFVRIYAAVSDQVITLQKEEIDDGKWLGASDLDQWINRDARAFASTFTVIWQHYRTWLEQNPRPRV